MIISVANPVQATYIFTAIFIVALFVFSRPKKDSEFFSTDLSQELKGLAILAVIFSHIGYFLVNDDRFLFPLSIIAGVGVNLFLFLSGYGLTVSSLQKKYSIRQFYQRRLLKLFIPFWTSLAVFLLLDLFVLRIFYSGNFIGQSILGFFPQADLYQNLNSPLWYFTLILFYYLIFPIIFSKKYSWLSAVGIYIFSAALIHFEPHFIKDVLPLYKVHLTAFPLGMIMASLIRYKDKIKIPSLPSWFNKISYYVGLIVLLFVAGYTAYYSGVGKSPLIEELVSLVTMASILGVFILKKIEFRLLYIFGVFSYEIYLLHWPILYRYDIFFSWLPVWLAVLLYLLVFLGLGWLLQNFSGKLTKLNFTKKSENISVSDKESSAH